MVGAFKLPVNAGGSGGINYTVDVFTSSGTYTKPANLDYCYVLMVSGGGGGGSGRRGANLTNKYGGAAGNGAMLLSRFNNADLSATESVTVGAGGNGGAASTTDNTNGTAGTAGSTTNFKYGATFGLTGGTSVRGATGVLPGFTTPSSINLSANRYKPIFLFVPDMYLNPNVAANDSHRGNTFNNNAVNRNSNISPFNCTSAGGSINISNNQLNAGILGGFYDDAGVLTDEIGGTSALAAAVQPTQFYTFGQWFAKLFPWFNPADANYNVGRGGLGGGCGDLAGTIAATQGAAALGYGAGGGGGGASTNGANSGAGGKGGDGIVIIINVLT